MLESIRFYIDAFGGWRRSSGLACLSISLGWAIIIMPPKDGGDKLFEILNCIIFLIAACILLSGKMKHGRHFWQRSTDPPPIPRDPHGAIMLNQKLLAKFQKSR